MIPDVLAGLAPAPPSSPDPRPRDAADATSSPFERVLGAAEGGRAAPADAERVAREADDAGETDGRAGPGRDARKREARPERSPRGGAEPSAMALSLAPPAPTTPAAPAPTSASGQAATPPPTTGAPARRDGPVRPVPADAIHAAHARPTATPAATAAPSARGAQTAPSAATVPASIRSALAAGAALTRDVPAAEGPRGRPDAKRGDDHEHRRTGTATPDAAPSAAQAAPAPAEAAPVRAPAAVRAAAPALPLPEDGADPAVVGALLPRAAHLRLSSDTLGDIALHLRLANGAAHVRVETAAPEAVQARAPELYRAMAADGIPVAKLEITPRDAPVAAARSADGTGAAGADGGSERRQERDGGEDEPPPTVGAPRPRRSTPRRRGITA